MSEEILKKIILEKFNFKDFQHINLTKLGEAKVYLVIIKNSKYIVRISKHPYSIQNNYYALTKLYKFNFVPKPIKIDTQKGYNYSIETFLEGEIKSNLLIQGIQKILEKISKLNSIKSNKCGYFNSPTTNWQLFVKENLILNYSKDFLKNYPNGTELISYALKNIPKSKDFTLLHGDLNQENIIFKDENCFFIDFESAFYGEKEYDLAYLNFNLNFSEEFITKITNQFNYNKHKIYYYELCILIRKIALAPKKKLKERIKKIEEVYKKLKKC